MPKYSSCRRVGAIDGAAPEDEARHLERPQIQCEDGTALLHLDLAHPVGLVEHDGVEELGVLDREEQERQPIVGKLRERFSGNQTGVGQPTITGSSGAMNGVARKMASHRPLGLRLHHVGDGRSARSRRRNTP